MLFWGLSVLLCKQFATFIGDTDSLCFKPLLILRMKFVLNIFTAKAFICGGYICIDGFLKKNICLVQVGAVV